MGYNTNPLVFRAGVRPVWQGDGRFWYRVTTPEGTEFVMVESASGTKAPAFDHAKLRGGAFGSGRREVRCAPSALHRFRAFGRRTNDLFLSPTPALEMRSDRRQVQS